MLPTYLIDDHGRRGAIYKTVCQTTNLVKRYLSQVQQVLNNLGRYVHTSVLGLDDPSPSKHKASLCFPFPSETHDYFVLTRLRRSRKFVTDIGFSNDFFLYFTGKGSAAAASSSINWNE